MLLGIVGLLTPAMAQSWTWTISVDVNRSPANGFTAVDVSELEYEGIGFYNGTGTNGTFAYDYASRVGNGANIGTALSISFTNSTLVDGWAYNNTRAWDDLQFVSTGGSGSITATFEIVYLINKNYSWMSASNDTDLYLYGGVTLNASRMGSTFWSFDADETVQTYYGDSSPFVGDFVTGASLYTGTFEAGQGFRFDLRTDTSIETTGANAMMDVDAYVILRDLTDGFALVSASGATYSAVPEPSSYGVLAGLMMLGAGLGRRRGQRK